MATLIAIYLRSFAAAAFLVALPFFGSVQTTSAHSMDQMDIPMPAPDCALDCARAASMAVSPKEVQVEERQAEAAEADTTQAQAYLQLADAFAVSGELPAPVYTGSAFRPPDLAKLFVRYLD